MIQRILKAMAILTPIAVFCSLNFGGGDTPRSSVLDPLLPAPAHAAWECFSNSYCPWPTSGCAQFQWQSFCLRNGLNCCNVSQQQCVGGTGCP